MVRWDWRRAPFAAAAQRVPSEIYRALLEDTDATATPHGRRGDRTCCPQEPATAHAVLARLSGCPLNIAGSLLAADR